MKDVSAPPHYPMPVTKSSYDPAYFRMAAEIEDRHFWYCSRGQVIARVAAQVAAGLVPRCRILEVGCGTGSVLRLLEQACPHAIVVGVDFFGEGLRIARQRTTCPLVQADIAALPFAIQFHLIGLFDVLEHLSDDLQELRNLHSRLAPGGALLLTVPAHPWLWSYFDVASRHCRRYEPAELEKKLKATGYRVEYVTQFMVSLLPMLWLARRLVGWLEPNRANDAARAQELAAREFRVIPVINELMGWLLGLELGWIAGRRRLPIGTSLLAIARKDS